MENVAQFYLKSHNFWLERARPVAQNFDEMRPWCHLFILCVHFSVFEFAVIQWSVDLVVDLLTFCTVFILSMH